MYRVRLKLGRAAVPERGELGDSRALGRKRTDWSDHASECEIHTVLHITIERPFSCLFASANS